MKRLLMVLVLTAAPLGATAHELAKGPNGGPLVESAGHHIEMVASGTELVLFLTGEADALHPSAGARNARAVVQDAGKTATVELKPVEPNKLIASLPSPLGKGARVVVSATLGDGHAVQARFVKN